MNGWRSRTSNTRIPMGILVVQEAIATRTEDASQTGLRSAVGVAWSNAHKAWNPVSSAARQDFSRSVKLQPRGAGKTPILTGDHSSLGRERASVRGGVSLVYSLNVRSGAPERT